MTPEGEDRLRAHVERIVRLAAVPRRDRRDVADEMLGHLAESVERLRIAGADEAAAVDAALRDFGAPDVVSSELARTYHSSLWLSTIGVLVAERESLPREPGAITAMRWILILALAIEVVAGGGAVLTATPVRALLLGIGAIAFIVPTWLAVTALGRGQRWAVRYAVAVLALMLGSGVVQMITVPPGTTTFSISAIAAGLALLGAATSGARIEEYVAGSPPVAQLLNRALGILLVGSWGLQAGAAAVADPTQATAADATMTVAVACGRKDLHGDVVLPDRQYAEITVDTAWRRADVLPFGIGGSLGDTIGGDTLGFRVIEPAPTDREAGPGVPSWMLALAEADVHVVETGEVAGWFGSTSPSNADIPPTIGSFTVGVDVGHIAPGRTIRTRWTIAPTEDGTHPWPVVEVAYAHLDRFVLIGQATCGQRVVGSARTSPAPVSGPPANGLQIP